MKFYKRLWREAEADLRKAEADRAAADASVRAMAALCAEVARALAALEVDSEWPRERLLAAIEEASAGLRDEFYCSPCGRYEPCDQCRPNAPEGGGSR